VRHNLRARGVMDVSQSDRGTKQGSETLHARLKRQLDACGSPSAVAAQAIRVVNTSPGSSEARKRARQSPGSVATQGSSQVSSEGPGKRCVKFAWCFSPRIVMCVRPCTRNVVESCLRAALIV
jgi:hypothetical protein